MRQARFGRSVRFCIRSILFKALASFFCNGVALAGASESLSVHGYNNIKTKSYSGESWEIKSGTEDLAMRSSAPGDLAMRPSARDLAMQSSAQETRGSGAKHVRRRGSVSLIRRHGPSAGRASCPDALSRAFSRRKRSSPSAALSPRAPCRDRAGQRETQKGLRPPCPGGLGWARVAPRA